MAQDNNKKSDWDALQDVLEQESQKTIDDGLTEARQDKAKDAKRAKKAVKEKQSKADERKTAQGRKKARITKDAAAIIGRSLGFVDPNEKVALALASESAIKDSLDDGKMTAVVAMAKKSKRPADVKTDAIIEDQAPLKTEDEVKPAKKKRRVKAATPEEERETDKAFSALLAQIDNVAGETAAGKRRTKSSKREKSQKSESNAVGEQTESNEQTTTIPAPEIVTELPIVVEPVVELQGEGFASSVAPEQVDAPIPDTELAVAASAEIVAGETLAADGSVEKGSLEEAVSIESCPIVPKSDAPESIWSLPDPAEQETNPFESLAEKTGEFGWSDDEYESIDRAPSDFETFLNQEAPQEEEEVDETNDEPQETFDFGEFGGDFWNVEDSIDVQWGRSPARETSEDATGEADATEIDETLTETQEDETDDDSECDEIELVAEEEETTEPEPEPAPFIDLDKNPEAFFAFGVDDEEDLCFTPRESKPAREKKAPQKEQPREEEAQKTPRESEERPARNERKRRREERAREENEFVDALDAKAQEPNFDFDETTVFDEPASEAFAPEPRERKKARRERADEKNELVELEPRDVKKERKARDLELFEEPRERRERRRVEREEELDDAREARAKRRRESDEETERIARAKKRREEEEREARIRERERAQDAVIAASQREERTLPTWDEALSYVVNFNLSRRNQRTRAK